MQQRSPLSNLDASVLEELYKQYQANPESIDSSWKDFFMGFDLALKNFGNSKQHITANPVKLDKEFKILNIINGYRQRGHLFTRTNPVRTRRQYSPTLDIQNFGLNEAIWIPFLKQEAK
jgi:2-oxoglutarate dehydrogenase E1 component